MCMLWVSGTHLPHPALPHGWPQIHCHLSSLALALTRPISPFALTALFAPVLSSGEKVCLFVLVCFRDRLLPQNPSWWPWNSLYSPACFKLSTILLPQPPCSAPPPTPCLCLPRFTWLGLPRFTWSPVPAFSLVPLASSVHRQTSSPHSSLRLCRK